MPTQVNTNYSANFQKFVDFADKAHATKGEDTVARFKGMPVGDYKGRFASLFRSSDVKTANDKVRDLFRKTVADMFGGEKFIPDSVRDSMKLEDFGKGKPLTARRINLVKTAIDTHKAETDATVDKILATMPHSKGVNHEVYKAAVNNVLARARDDADLTMLLQYGKFSLIYGIMLDYGNSLRTDEEIAKRLDALRDNINELRTAAKGDRRVIKAVLPQFVNLAGKSLRPGVLTKMFEAAAKVDLKYLTNISTQSSPKQMVEVMCAVEKDVAALAKKSNAYAGKKLLFVDDLVGVNGFALSILFSRCDDKTLRAIKTAFRSENAAKVAYAFERFHSLKFPAGTSATNKVRSAIKQFSFTLRSMWVLRMDALMAVDDALGVPFDRDSAYVKKISDGDFKDVYDVVEKNLYETHKDLIDIQDVKD